MTPGDALHAVILVRLKLRQARATLWTEDWRRVEKCLDDIGDDLAVLKLALEEEVDKQPRI